MGSWLVFSSRLASASSGRRDTGPSLTMTSGMPSLRIQSSSSKQQLHSVLAGPSQKNWKLSSFTKRVRGAQTQVVRGGSHVALAWLLGSWVWICTRRLEGGSWTIRYPWKVWESRRPALCPSSHGFAVGFVRTCLGSGRAQIASRSATGVVNLGTMTLLLGMPRKGKVPRAPWVALLRKDPALCRLCGAPPPTPPDANKSTDDMVKALELL